MFLHTNTSVTHLILELPTDPGSFSGRITFTGTQQTLNSKGRKLIKQECILTDESGSIRLVLWENDITNIISGETYSIHYAVVKSFNSQIMSHSTAKLTLKYWKEASSQNRMMQGLSIKPQPLQSIVQQKGFNM